VNQKQRPVLGEVVLASHVSDSHYSPRRIRTIILLLAGSVALLMTGFGIIMPIFARRLGEFGDGVGELGLMTMVFALSQLLFAPVLGGLADRHGRRPIILLALAAVTASYIGYIFAPTTAVFIAIRGIAGGMTAGLFPAAMGVVADVVPEDRRARWVGIIMGSYAVGMIFGPALGGFLYDGWGYAAPFTLSAVVAFMALVAAIFLVPETRTPQIRQRDALRAKRIIRDADDTNQSVWAMLPRPLAVFGALLFIDFIGSFAFAFVEPQMIFYMYDDLAWTTVQFGIVVGAYGIAMVFGQMVLGQLSDRWGRKPLVMIGLLVSMSLYVGMAMLNSFVGMAIIAAISGLGQALYSPALSAFVLDITTDDHRSRVMGLKESSLALGGVLGPLLVAVVAPWTSAQGVFWIAFGLVFLSFLLGLILLKEPKRAQRESTNVQDEVSQQRVMAAQASLRGIVMRATFAREQSQVG
jgi:MFS transporter, DHA1 family, multidrug resistance protein